MACFVVHEAWGIKVDFVAEFFPFGALSLC